MARTVDSSAKFLAYPTIVGDLDLIALGGVGDSCRGISVGVSGALTVVSDAGDTVILPAHPDGFLFPVQAAKILAAGAVGTNIVVYW